MSEAGAWNVGLFECFLNPKTCLFASFCLPCVYGKNASVEATKNANAGIDLPSCCMCCCTLGCCLYLPCSLRSNIRNNHNIKGSLTRDAFDIYCCTICAMAQHHLELQTRFGVLPSTTIVPSSNILGDQSRIMGGSFDVGRERLKANVQEKNKPQFTDEASPNKISMIR